MWHTANLCSGVGQANGRRCASAKRRNSVGICAYCGERGPATEGPDDFTLLVFRNHLWGAHAGSEGGVPPDDALCHWASAMGVSRNSAIIETSQEARSTSVTCVVPGSTASWERGR